MGCQNKYDSTYLKNFSLVKCVHCNCQKLPWWGLPQGLFNCIGNGSLQDAYERVCHGCER